MRQVEDLVHSSALKTEATSPPKRRYIFNGLQGIISQNVRVFHNHLCVNFRSCTDPHDLPRNIKFVGRVCNWRKHISWEYTARRVLAFSAACIKQLTVLLSYLWLITCGLPTSVSSFVDDKQKYSFFPRDVVNFRVNITTGETQPIRKSN
jgi:hypothetical protein